MEPAKHPDEAPSLLPPDPLRGAWHLDVLIAVTILLILGVLAMQSGQVAIFKARLTKQVSAVTPWRTQFVEHFALTGEWKISAGELPRNFAVVRPEGIPWKGSTAAGIVDGVIVTLGRHPGHSDGMTILNFIPAVPKGEERPTVLWLCGRASTPAGWETPPVSMATNLSGLHQYSMCRRSTG
jgi:hypothetical protein